MLRKAKAKEASPILTSTVRSCMVDMTVAGV
jgi:hypothetical protein